MKPAEVLRVRGVTLVGVRDLMPSGRSKRCLVASDVEAIGRAFRLSDELSLRALRRISSNLDGHATFAETTVLFHVIQKRNASVSFPAEFLLVTLRELRHALRLIIPCILDRRKPAVMRD